MGKFLVDESTVKESTLESESFKSRAASDDLQLDSLLVPEIPPNVLFPEQLNRYLREQVRNLTLENGNLRRSLDETQDELSTTKQKLSKAPPVIPARSSEMAANKISELSKKLREQTAELETLRTRVKELEASLKQAEENINQVQTPLPTPSQTELAEKDKQIKILTEKLQASNSKMCDFRNQCQALKQEMKLAQKVIESEVGERIVLQDLVKENGNWRGRAQQIIALQNKVQHLQEQLSSSSVSETTTPAVHVIRQMERDRRASYEETSKQLNQKTIQMEDLRKKLDAAKARNRVLENEIFQVKTKLSVLLDKNARDEQLVAALNTQINVFEDRSKTQVQCFSKLQENINKLQKELGLERSKNEQLQNALIDRENRLRSFEDQTYEFRTHRKHLVQEDGDKFTNDAYCRDKSTETSLSPNKVPASIVEMERLRLLELLTVVNRRLEEARRESIEVDTQLRKEKSKNAKLETKIARLELERVGAVKTVRGNYNNKVNDSLNENEVATKHQIEYLEEECLALKTRIATLQMEKEDDLKLFTAMTEMRDHLTDGQLKNLKFKEEKDFGKKLNKRPKFNARKSDTRLSFSSDESRSDFRLPL